MGGEGAKCKWRLFGDLGGMDKIRGRIKKVKRNLVDEKMGVNNEWDGCHHLNSTKFFAFTFNRVIFHPQISSQSVNTKERWEFSRYFHSD